MVTYDISHALRIISAASVYRACPTYNAKLLIADTLGGASPFCPKIIPLGPRIPYIRVPSSESLYS
jgi:hypothetical protein